MARLRDAPDDLFALVGRTADAVRLPPEFVEKDFWITELLRSVARPVDNGRVVFTGGTSLSKAHDLLSDAVVRAGLGESHGFAIGVEAEMLAISAKWGFPHEPRPDAGFARSPAFDSGHPSQEILAGALAGLGEIVLGVVPTVEDCRRVVEESADLL